MCHSNNMMQQPFDIDRWCAEILYRLNVQGLRKHRRWRATYQAWHNMIRRCYSEDCESYKSYGAKGVEVCLLWQKHFMFFLYDMGFCPEQLTLDRKDPAGNYEKGNCRWVTCRVNSQNKRSNRG